MYLSRKFVILMLTLRILLFIVMEPHHTNLPHTISLDLYRGVVTFRQPMFKVTPQEIKYTLRLTTVLADNSSDSYAVDIK